MTTGNPIAERLGRTIDTRQVSRVKIIAWGIGLLLGAVSLWATLDVFAGTHPSLNLADLIFPLALLGCLLIPVVAATFSAILTHHDLQDETYDHLRLTPLSSEAIVDGYVQGVAARLAMLRVFAYALLLPLAGTIACAILFYLNLFVERLVPPGMSPYPLFPVGFVMGVIVVSAIIGLAVLRYFTTTLIRLAAVAGVSTAFRLRHSHVGLSAAVSGAAVLPVAACLLVSCAAPVIVQVLYTFAPIAGWLLLAIPLLLAAPSMLSRWLQRSLVRSIDRAR